MVARMSFVELGQNTDQIIVSFQLRWCSIFHLPHFSLPFRHRKKRCSEMKSASINKFMPNIFVSLHSLSSFDELPHVIIWMKRLQIPCYSVHLNLLNDFKIHSKDDLLNLWALTKCFDELCGVSLESKVGNIHSTVLAIEADCGPSQPCWLARFVQTWIREHKKYLCQCIQKIVGLQADHPNAATLIVVLLIRYTKSSYKRLIIIATWLNFKPIEFYLMELQIDKVQMQMLTV